MPNYKSQKTGDSTSQQLTVAVRIRPLFNHEVQKGATKIARKADNKMVLLQDPTAGDPVDILRAKRAQEKRYVFDWGFDEHSSQEEVYEKTTKNLVENVVEGFNGTVFAYGATGSGKTHTMVGVDDDPGIMVRALKDLFKEIDKKNHIYDISMSYLEIYNEMIRDLLNPSSLQLELREDAKGNHQVAGLSEVNIASSEQVMSLLMEGNKRRTQESTGANKCSSRSHAVLVVHVKKQTPVHSHQQEMRTGRLYMVDLAGSERAAHTQNTGKRLLEGAHINKSLLALGNCINALAERNSRYVNFRDSKLTRILKEPLAGNCKTVMVGHISPSHFQFEESRNTLAYADRAKNITTKIRSNVSDVSYHVAQYQTIINELRQEIATLHQKIHNSPTDENNNKLTDDEMKQLKKQLIESFNSQMDVRRRMMEIDNTLLAQSIEFDKLGMIISEWETEKAVAELENEDESESKILNKSHERNDTPGHVQRAWEELQFLKNQHQRYLEMREDSETDYKSCKQRTHSVTESLSEKASSREQRELLHLLTRVYELEIEKLEMQSSQLCREHELRCRDLMILRYDRQRQLCDEIITKQRMLIDAMATGEKSKNINARRELNELYRIYQQEIQDLNGERTSSLGQLSPFGSSYRPSSSRLRPLGSSGSMLELHLLDINKNNDISLHKSINRLPPIGNGSDSSETDRRLFQRRRKTPFRRGSDDSNLPPVHHQRRANSRFSDSSRSSESANDRRYDSLGSMVDSAIHSSSNGGRSSDSSDYSYQKLDKLNEIEEPLRRRCGLLPTLRTRRRREFSSDSEITARDKQKHFSKEIYHVNRKLNPQDQKHQLVQEKNSKLRNNDKSFGY